MEAAADGAADEVKNEGDHSLGELQNDVADKPIADDDIGGAGRGIPSLHVADEVQAARGEQGVGFLDQPIALAGFLTIAEEAHARAMQAKHALHVGGAKVSKVNQMVWLAVGIGAHIHNDRLPARQRKHRAYGWPIHSGEWAQR